ncbi:MAG: hypothetical protein JWO44_1235 [Bacteroidetes bacterium]|nr:hypothetical protein [Bacteroidota bacterium]
MKYVILCMAFLCLLETDMAAQQRSGGACNNCIVKYPLINTDKNLLERFFDSVYIKSSVNYYKIYSIEEDSISIVLRYDSVHKVADVSGVSENSYYSFSGKYIVDDSIYKSVKQDRQVYYYQKLKKDGMWTYIIKYKFNIVQTENWQNGVKNGLYRLIKDDTVVFGGNYKDGMRIGEWKDDNEGGLYTVSYYDNSENAVYIKYIENNVVIEEIFLTDICSPGKNKEVKYSFNNRFRISYYKDGKLRSKGCFTKKGNSQDEIPYGVHQYWDEKGRMSVTKYDESGKEIK